MVHWKGIGRGSENLLVNDQIHMMLSRYERYREKIDNETGSKGDVHIQASNIKTEPHDSKRTLFQVDIFCAQRAPLASDIIRPLTEKLQSDLTFVVLILV